MCLSKVFRKETRDKILAKLPDEFTVWKAVDDWGPGYAEYGCESRYVTYYQGIPLHAGEVKFKTNIIKNESVWWFPSFLSYRGGGHFWLHKKDADDCKSNKIVRCRVKKKWITNMGEQSGGIVVDGVVVVVKKAIFPRYIGYSKIIL